MRRSLVLALALLAAPGTAGACSLVPFTPSDVPVYGQACAITTHVTEIRAVGLGEATDLGGGMFLQDIFDGNGCYWEANLLVHDCQNGEILVIGPDHRELMLEPQQTGIDSISRSLQTRAALVGPQGLDAAEAQAQEHGYSTVLRLPAGTRLSVNGFGVASNCACETLYSPATGGN